MISSSFIRNNPLTVADAKRAVSIYGPSVPSLKGRTTRVQPEHIPDTIPISIPRQILTECQNGTLCLDFFSVQGIPVFHAISRRLMYRSVSFPTSRSKKQILKHLQMVLQKYTSKGFRITSIHADNEFEKIRTDIGAITLVTPPPGDHVPEAERSIRTIKESSRAATHDLPYSYYPREVVRALIRYSVMILNAFPSKSGISTTLTPRNILDGLPHLDYNHLNTQFGSYVQLRVDRTVTNTMLPRTIGAIVLDPKGAHGNYNFLSLETGKRVNGVIRAFLPATDEVIARIDDIGMQQKQAKLNDGRLLFEWSPGNPIDNNDNDLVDLVYNDLDAHHNDQAENVEAAILEDINIPHEGIPFPDLNLVSDEDSVDTNDNETDDEAEEEDEDEDRNDNDDIDPIPIDDNVTSDEEEIDPDVEPDANFVLDDIIDDPENEGAPNVAYDIIDMLEHEGAPNDASENEGAQANDDSSTSSDDHSDSSSEPDHFAIDPDGGRGKRKRKPDIKFGFLQTKCEDLNKEQMDEYWTYALDHFQSSGETKPLERCMCAFLFTQMSAKKGIKKHGRVAEEALMKEFFQFKRLDVLHPVHASSLTKTQKQDALRMISLIKEKRDHTPENPHIKGRSCADGRPEKNRYNKDEISSPTVSMDAFFISLLIDAKEERAVNVADVAGAYLHAFMEDVVHMRIEGNEVDLMCEVHPEWDQFVTIQNGKKVLYVILNKALYGCVKSAMLWYNLFTSTLQDMGFELNPYDLCVANKTINGKQCTVCWYVDDNKLSHVQQSVLDDVIEKIEHKFGKMTVSKGNRHNFLGMDILFQKDKTVNISMKEMTKKAIDDFDDDIVRNSVTPAMRHLFEVKDSPLLSEEKQENFHSVTSLLLYLSRRCRLDIQTTVAYLTTRVSCPTEDDWKKLKRCLQYLRGTLDLTLTLGADDITRMMTWVDVSYAVHDDMKSHTGGCMSWGTGTLLTMCQKQKLNTKSSTEGEVVGVSDFLPHTIWAKYFLEAQGHEIQENIIYQDNQSAIKIEKNGKQSCGSKSRHIHVRYFFIKDRLSSEDIEVIFCPTEIMLADFFTKPLQGSLFRRLRDVVLGYKHISTLNDTGVSCSEQERVGFHEIDKMAGNSAQDSHDQQKDDQQTICERPTKSYADALRGF